MPARLLSSIVALAALAAPASAGAADSLVAADPAARQLTALDGTLVWVSGGVSGHRLWLRSPDGVVRRVEGAPWAPFYTSIDLGRDARNRLVLTYQRCSSGSRCRVVRDDLRGHRSGVGGLRSRRCVLSTAPALWRSRAVYGQLCRTAQNVVDRERTGLYLRTGDGSPRRTALPRDAVRFGVSDIASVDVRGDRVAAIAADIYEYAFTTRASGGRLDSFLAASSEGESNAHAAGLSLAAGGTLWTLTDSEHAGDPNEATIFRLDDVLDLERLVNPAGPDQASGFRAIDLAVDAGTLYLLAPGTGIVSHAFAPAGPCTR